MKSWRSQLFSNLHWILGIAVALIGVLLARLIAPEYFPQAYRVWGIFLGHATCLLGLLIIAKGIYKKTKDS